MPTSELSDALNPYYALSRARSGHASSTTQRHPTSQQPAIQQDNGESELVMADQSRTPDAPPTPPLNSAHTSQTSRVTAVQELLRFLASTREACEIEKKRRAAWEREMEAKHMLQKAEMERRILELQQEVSSLRACLPYHQSVRSSGAFTSGDLVSDLHPGPHSAVLQQPTPTTPSVCAHSALAHPTVAPVDNLTPTAKEPSVPASIVPSPSPPSARFIPVDPSSRERLSYSRSKSATLSNSDEEDISDTSSFPQHRLRRRNHHDNRCLTVQHAMRNHLLRIMQLDSDKHLPDSHVEGTPLGADEPVRFVWDKTPKQSVHNSHMKERVLQDLKANRRLYRHVPDKEFGKKSLEAAFDQAFVTLRQKFKAQRDASVAKNHKQREDMKAMRARRLSRRKTCKKLGNRSEARSRIPDLEHVTFDGAMQLECMSSEESEIEEDSPSGTRTIVLRIRGCPWRSLRLQHFFDVLDQEDKVVNAQKPRRGVGRKERYRGPPKDGLSLPPKGVASWMISKRWMAMIRRSHSEVLEMIKDVIVDTEGFDWSKVVPHLSIESDDEGLVEPGPKETDQYGQVVDSASFSLQNALTHMT
ncbi:hypothetical protein ID866_5424 [Astraeus odoratus]|nr:hypothetical protein ID866_5424 [Astraeus odoratus]